jgi:hypothetical protein
MKIASLLPLVLLLPGCASSLQSHQIKPDLQAGSAVDGVPFRKRERLTIELYRKTDKGYELVNAQMQTMADPSKIYVLNFSGQLFADSSVKFEQLDDGTLSTVKLGSTPHAAEAVDAATAGVDTYVTTAKAIADAKKTKADAAKADADKKIAEADAIIASSQNATELRYAALVIEQQLGELPADAKGSDRKALEGKLVLAKMKARAAAAKSGLDNPFPE